MDILRNSTNKGKSNQIFHFCILKWVGLSQAWVNNSKHITDRHNGTFEIIIKMHLQAKQLNTL